MITIIRLVNTFITSHGYHFLLFLMMIVTILNPQLFEKYKVVFGKIN